MHSFIVPDLSFYTALRWQRRSDERGGETFRAGPHLKPTARGAQDADASRRRGARPRSALEP